jgi:hypothetical protein
MALVPCKDCRTEISDRATVCPKCGGKPKRTNWLLWILFAVAICAFLIFRVFSMSPRLSGQAREQEDIKTCRARLTDPSLDKATINAMTDMCSKMEAGYRSRYSAEP